MHKATPGCKSNSKSFQNGEGLQGQLSLRASPAQLGWIWAPLTRCWFEHHYLSCKERGVWGLTEVYEPGE